MKTSAEHLKVAKGSQWPRDPYQALLTQQTEQDGVAHLPQVLETHSLELSVLNDVLQLVVEELQDTWMKLHCSYHISATDNNTQ